MQNITTLHVKYIRLRLWQLRSHLHEKEYENQRDTNYSLCYFGVGVLIYTNRKTNTIFTKVSYEIDVLLSLVVHLWIQPS